MKAIVLKERNFDRAVSRINRPLASMKCSSPDSIGTLAAKPNMENTR
jgi:hypothetical protein